MKIKQNDEITAFLNRCQKNLESNRKNDFVDLYVTKQTEKKTQRAMKDAGFEEFTGDSSKWPSLFIKAEDWVKSPYYSSISFQNIQDEHFSFETSIIDAGYLFNIDALQKDENRELNDWMKLRAFDREVETMMLYQDDEDWMLNAPSESVTNDPMAEKAHGNIVTFGLGIGYFVFMAMRNPNVTSITVVERSKEVIRLFEQVLRPQFPSHIPLTILSDDAFNRFHPEFLSQFDYIYTDIWQSSLDGLELIERLLEQYNPPLERSDYWIEDSCMEPIWTLVYLHYRELYEGKNITVADDYQRRMKKVRRYFESVDRTIDSVEELKFMMYDRCTLRKILSINL